MLYEWNHILCNTLIIFFSSQYNSHNFHLIVSCIKFVLFYCWVEFHGMDIPVCLFSIEWHIWAVSRFGLIQIKGLWTVVYRFLCKNTFSFLWDKHPGVQLLGLIISLCLIFKATTNLLNRVAAPFYPPAQQRRRDWFH